MRVITGKYRGKKLFSPIGNDVRPTTDRIKETVFNILSAKRKFDGAMVLDLFSGSGALGIEALSRGAKTVVFVDKSRDSFELTKKNLAHVGASAEVYNTDYQVALKKLEGRQFDFIFLDPPYFGKNEQNIFDLIQKYDLLTQNGIIFLEHSTAIDLPQTEERYIIDNRVCGKTSITFFELNQGQGENM